MANLDDGSLTSEHFIYCHYPLETQPFSAYNEVEAYRYKSGQWNGPYVYFAGSTPCVPNYNSFYESVWAADLDMSNFDQTCYTNLCDQNICQDGEFCKADWEDFSDGTTKQYYCCASESSDLSECNKPGYLI